MTSRGPEGESEQDGNTEIGHLGNNEESPLAEDTRTTLGIEMDEMGANALSTRCYTRVSGGGSE